MRFIRRFMSTVALATAVLVGAAVVSFAPVANATVYNFEFDSLSVGNLTAIGTVTIDQIGANLEVTAITGTISGTDLSGGPQTINGIVTNPNFPSTSTSSDSVFTFDNLAFNGDPHLDVNGILFTTTENSSGFWNLWWSPTAQNYKLAESTGGTFAFFEIGNLSTTPLPATLPLFASGLGALGLLGWRRKRKTQAVA